MNDFSFSYEYVNSELLANAPHVQLHTALSEFVWVIE